MWWPRGYVPLFRRFTSLAQESFLSFFLAFSKLYTRTYRSISFRSDSSIRRDSDFRVAQGRSTAADGKKMCFRLRSTFYTCPVSTAELSRRARARIAVRIRACPPRTHGGYARRPRLHTWTRRTVGVRGIPATATRRERQTERERETLLPRLLHAYARLIEPRSRRLRKSRNADAHTRALATQRRRRRVTRVSTFHAQRAR